MFLSQIAEYNLLCHWDHQIFGVQVTGVTSYFTQIGIFNDFLILKLSYVYLIDIQNYCIIIFSWHNNVVLFIIYYFQYKNYNIYVLSIIYITIA